mmetsp:Transcript_81550/g.219166  ORF Transcript_81550/g.219166 Transcript_81550/m.219166 type:complete len:275 (+) Transcript_81550:2238-3062(+)
MGGSTCCDAQPRKSRASSALAAFSGSLQAWASWRWALTSSSTPSSQILPTALRLPSTTSWLWLSSSLTSCSSVVLQLWRPSLDTSVVRMLPPVCLMALFGSCMAASTCAPMWSTMAACMAPRCMPAMLFFSTSPARWRTSTGWFGVCAKTASAYSGKSGSWPNCPSTCSTCCCVWVLADPAAANASHSCRTLASSGCHATAMAREAGGRGAHDATLCAAAAVRRATGAHMKSSGLDLACKYGLYTALAYRVPVKSGASSHAKGRIETVFSPTCI